MHEAGGIDSEKGTLQASEHLKAAWGNWNDMNIMYSSVKSVLLL